MRTSSDQGGAGAEGPWSLPNLLTMVRLGLVPVFIAAFLSGRRGLALGAFIVASVTDYLDGLAARWLEQRTRLGAWLDPLADKSLMISALVLLARERTLPAWLLWALVARDLGMAWALWLARRRSVEVVVAPTRLGKYATFLVMALVVVGLVDPSLRGPWRDSLVVLSLECFGISVVQYFAQWKRSMQRARKPLHRPPPDRSRSSRWRPGARTSGVPTPPGRS